MPRAPRRASDLQSKLRISPSRAVHQRLSLLAKAIGANRRRLLLLWRNYEFSQGRHVDSGGANTTPQLFSGRFKLVRQRPVVYRNVRVPFVLCETQFPQLAEAFITCR